MITLQKVRRNFQVTLPATIREKIGIKEGDYIEFETREEGILIKPKEIIDKSQSWFWSKEWQKGEKEADRDIKLGRTKTFDSVDDLLAELKK